MKTTKTTLTVANGSKDPVKVYLTLGDTSGFVNDVHGLFGITEHGLQGSFELAGKEIRAVETELPIAGNICFETPPINCMCDEFPNGVNLFEFCLNNEGTVPHAQETIDISCVAGVNSLLEVNMTGGTRWNAGPKFPNISQIENRGLYENTGRIGVYPYGCDICTGSQNPPSCPNAKPYADPQPFNFCNVQRPASGGGGMVNLRYMGKI